MSNQIYIIFFFAKQKLRLASILLMHLPTTGLPFSRLPAEVDIKNARLCICSFSFLSPRCLSPDNSLFFKVAVIIAWFYLSIFDKLIFITN